MLKRRNLKEVYFEVATSLQKLDENAISILDSYYPGGGVFTSLGEQMNRLGKRDYHLLIAGDLRENSACTIEINCLPFYLKAFKIW